MRQLGRLLAVAVMLASTLALADPNDMHIAQLGNPTPGGLSYSPAANGNFRAFAKEFAAGLTGYTLTATHTLGYNGFAISAELGVASFSDKVTLPTEKPFSGPLLLPSIHIRKGLPWSLELGGRVTWVDKSSMGAGTVEMRWAITEGYKVLPEVTLRGYAMKLFNAENFNLWGAGTDLSVGKRFAIGGMVTLSPYLGWNLGWSHASSSLLDFNPSRTEAESEVSPTAALANTGTYDEVTAGHNFSNRFYLGARFVGGVISIAAEISVTGNGSISAPDPNVPTPTTTRSLPSVVTFATAFGLEY